MTDMEFRDLEFSMKGDALEVSLLKYFFFEIDRQEIEKIGAFSIDKKKISIDASEEKATRKFDFLITKNIKNLKSKLTKKPAVYVHRNSGIPLLGYVAFGIVDRNSSLIEIKPATGCNLNCIYCSVDEGLDSKRGRDFVVEKDYLVDELRKVIEFKETDGIEVHIGPNGEPLLYDPLSELIRDIKKIKEVKTISMDTNGVLLTKEKIDELSDAGLTRFNLSLNAIDPEISKKLAGTGYNVDHIIEMAKHMAKKADVMLTPIWVPGYNDEEMGKLIEFAKEIGAGKTSPPIGIQNFLNYKFGRNPVKQMEWDEFFKRLKKLEKEHGIDLTFDSENYEIKDTKALPKPFKKGDVVKAEIICGGRMKKEKIGVAKGRVISVMNSNSDSKKIKVKITKSKHNIFVGSALK